MCAVDLCAPTYSLEFYISANITLEMKILYNFLKFNVNLLLRERKVAFLEDIVHEYR
jgi:hypothetical protein